MSLSALFTQLSIGKKLNQLSSNVTTTSLNEIKEWIARHVDQLKWSLYSLDKKTNRSRVSVKLFAKASNPEEHSWDFELGPFPTMGCKRVKIEQQGISFFFLEMKEALSFMETWKIQEPSILQSFRVELEKEKHEFVNKCVQEKEKAEARLNQQIQTKEGEVRKYFAQMEKIESSILDPF